MRTCIHCKEPMFSSLESIWIDGKNYDIHKKCKESYASLEKGCGEILSKEKEITICCGDFGNLCDKCMKSGGSE